MSKLSPTRISHSFVIMSRDRPEMLRQTVKLFKFLSHPDHELIISDNSSSLVNSKAAKNICSEYECIFWGNDNLSVMSHYHSILSRREYDYLTIIHDDDLIMPGFSSVVAAQLGNENNFSVIGYNALFFNAFPSSEPFGEIRCSGRRTLNEDSDVLIADPLELLLRWISPFCTGIAPISGCTFNLKCYEKWFFDIYSSSGLYFDTVLMMLLSEKAPIKWVSNNAVILLREHDSRLTSIASERDERAFAHAAKTYFSRPWQIRLLLKFYLHSSKRKRTFRPGDKAVIYFNYCVCLFICFIVWPQKVPKLLIRKLQDYCFLV